MRKPISKPLPPSHCPHSPLSHSPTQQSQYSHLLCLLLPLLLPIPHLYISLALFRCWGKGKTVPAASSPRAAKHTCLWGLTFTAPLLVVFQFVQISILLFTAFTRKHNSQPSPPCFTPPLLPLTSQFFLHHLFPCPQSFTSPPELYLALRHSHGSPVPIKIPFTSPSYPSFLTASNLQAYWTQHQNTLK